jgi:hypothetical protein
MRLLGLLFLGAGGAAIGLGWAGAANKSCVDCQMPYLLSGGAGSLSLVILGVMLLLIAQIRSEGRRIAERFDRFIETAGREISGRGQELARGRGPEENANGHDESKVPVSTAGQPIDLGPRRRFFGKKTGPGES